MGMVLSPQCFHNLNLHSDIFNHSNVHFWEYMQPGYDALGFISCTGTNFLVRMPHKYFPCPCPECCACSALSLHICRCLIDFVLTCKIPHAGSFQRAAGSWRLAHLDAH